MRFTLHKAPGAMVVAGATFLAACGGYQGVAVSPDEIPELEEALAQRPGDAEVQLRYAAALLATGNCDSATAVASSAVRTRPGAALGTLVLGRCMENSGNYDGALTQYDYFLENFPDARGAGAVGSRRIIAARQQAVQGARDALNRESQLAGQTPDPQTVAVLPVAIAGDSTYRPLSRGLAEMLTSDLNLLQRFQMVERLQVGALLDELDLQQSERVDQNTAARVGRLVQAGRMVQGLATIPDESDVRLEASVVQSDGQVTSPATTNGRLRDLLNMEKELVLGIAAQLGYQLTAAEREAILENGTRNLAAFLAYSRGLEAEDLGDYNAAAQHYGEAVRRDPGFRQARQGYRSSASVGTNQAPEQVTVAASADIAEPDSPALNPVGDAANTGLTDLFANSSEQTQSLDHTAGAGGATETPISQPDNTPAGTTGIIRIIFRLP